LVERKTREAMTMSTAFILLFIAAMVLLLGAVVAIVALVLFVLGSASGWQRLAQTYAATNPPPVNLAHRQTVKIGAVTYKRCATVGVAEEGLYLAIWRREALIPWQEIKNVGEATLYWRKMPTLTIGAPPVATIILEPAGFAMFRGRLPARIEPSRSTG
jgi:hypothetical protein